MNWGRRGVGLLTIGGAPDELEFAKIEHDYALELHVGGTCIDSTRALKAISTVLFSLVPILILVRRDIMSMRPA